MTPKELAQVLFMTIRLRLDRVASDLRLEAVEWLITKLQEYQDGIE